ncbi:hypothetical protein NliqN6_3829 [Naganishia liquefaciens]|uniref:Uncharacterized protein n=1 Tax=Naganishia liquefaciens TaxID=104408 RepID=A0A8H3TUJ1_9TREE|nr:hypothetical protein NliqN6_3829 [Naganishia liquefaciens]
MNVFESPMYKLSGFRVPLLPKIIMTTTAMIIGAAVIDRHVTPLTTRVDRRHWNNTLVDLEHVGTGSVPPTSTESIENLTRTAL